MAKSDLFLLASSILIQVCLALFLGHAYDMRIFMATGYLSEQVKTPTLRRT